MGEPLVRDPGARVGITYLNDRLYPSVGAPRFRYDVHDSGGFVVRHDLSGGEYALGLAMVFVRHPGSLVYLGHACPDDPAVVGRIRVDGGRGLVGHDVGCPGLGRQEVQR